jgi:hypothetical protein
MIAWGSPLLLELDANMAYHKIDTEQIGSGGISSGDDWFESCADLDYVG